LNGAGPSTTPASCNVEIDVLVIDK
jgi:hypothetical protein